MPDVRAKIAAHNADFADVCVGLCNRRVEFWRERDHIRDAMAGGHKPAIVIARDFVPPHVTIEFAVGFERQMRTAHMDERITITGQRKRTAKIEFIVELRLQFFVERGS